MVGDIEDQMTAGIDNSKYYLVFLTARFIIKVSGDNAADNCRKEFKYAALKNKIFIAVVMEEGVKDQRAWPSIIGLHLGSRLYIDASGDLTNPEYMNHVVDQIRNAARLLDVGAIPATTSGAAHPTSVFAIEPIKIVGSAGTKPLASLTMKEVEILFDALNLGAYKSVVAANNLNGDILSYCTSVEDFMSMGITLRPMAAFFLAKVTEFKAAGVPLTLLTPPPTGPPNAEALLQAARDGNLDAIRTCLNNHTDIESKTKVCTLCPLSTYIVAVVYIVIVYYMLLLSFLLNVGFYIYIDELNSMGCLTAVLIFSFNIFIIINIIKIVMFKYLFIFMLLLLFLLRIL
jgi:hypothetical protein